MNFSVSQLVITPHEKKPPPEKKKKSGRDRSDAATTDRMTRESYLGFRGYRTFRKQYDAEEWARANGACIFSYDVGKDASAKGFLVTGASELFNTLKNQPGWDRYYYEMLFTHRPCHLYLDIEYFPHSNPDSEHSFDVRMILIKKLIASKLHELYGLSIKRVVELDSSNAHKCSRHLVVKIAGHRWTDPSHCGAFMRRVAIDAFETTGQKVNNPFYLWPDECKDYSDPMRTMINVFDMGVYTQMRSIRLYGNTKKTANRSKLRFLVRHGEPKPTEENDFRLIGEQLDPKNFYDTLIQMPPKRPVQLIVATEYNNEPARWSSEDPVKRRLRSGLSMLPRIGLPSDPTGSTRGGGSGGGRSTGQRKAREFTRDGVTIRVDEKGRQFRVESGQLVPCLNTRRMFDRTTAATAVQAFDIFANEFGNYLATEHLSTRVYRCHPSRDELTARYQLDSRKCPIADKEHTRNHVSVLVKFNPESDMIPLSNSTQLGYPIMFYQCYNAVCKQQRLRPVELSFIDDKWRMRIAEIVLEWEKSRSLSCSELFEAFSDQ